MKYRPELDGLRALAVVPVIGFHAGFRPFRGGFVGVDVFFVISGFLISSLILEEVERRSFTFLEFYRRRARRILPALITVLFVMTPIVTLVLLPRDLKDYFQSVAAVATFCANVLFYHESGYFTSISELKPLIHCWSLAVEEQYYLIYPPFLILALRVGRKWTMRVLISVLCLSFASAQTIAHTSPSSAFYLLQYRCWEIMIGAVAALGIRDDRIAEHLRGMSGMLRETLSFTGVGAILIAIMTSDASRQSPSLYALIPTIGTAAVIVFTSDRCLVARLLAFRPLVVVGLLSYPAYLWHQPLMALTRYADDASPSMAKRLLIICITAVLAFVTWRYVERPIRLRRRSQQGRDSRFLLVSLASFAALGAIGHFSDGFSTRFLKSMDSRQLQVWHEYSLPWNEDSAFDDGDCRFHSKSISAAFIKRFGVCHAKYGKATVVLGDSHALNVYNALARQESSGFVVGLSQGGCRPHTPSKNCAYDKFLVFASINKNAIARVVYSQAGFYLIQGENGAIGERSLFEGASIPVFAENRLFVDRVIEYLSDLSTSVPVVWIGPRIEPHANVRALLRLALACKKVRADIVRPNVITTFENLDSFIAQRVRARSTFRYVSQIRAIEFSAQDDLADCHAVYWRDGDHWSAAGEVRFGKRLASAIGE